MSPWLRPRPGRSYLAGAPMLVAHRGGARLAPENTLVAFRQACDRWRADMLELDVRLTRDGHVVVIHDPTVDRTTDGSGRVCELTLAEIQSLDAGYRFTDLSGSHAFRGRGARVPTFEEVLVELTDVWINVECKEPPVAGPLVEIVARHGAEDRVLIAAENEGSRRGAAGYRGPWGASKPQGFLFFILHRLPGGSPYTPAADILQVPQWWKGLRVVTPRFVREAHRLNVPVQVWTVDDEADMRRLLDWGVDGIQTDRPDVLARVLTERVGRPPPPGFIGADA
ncbi:MAG TPA: glycerophosphodiester phosphodiesterase [Longimicrobiales bacterium]|nr:glycerophosphodiester phosphodiesterase [Longimicrobiales bacterium]